MVPTDLATLNSTVKMSFRNTGTFFGVHVASTALDLSYYDLSLAVGTVRSQDEIVFFFFSFCFDSSVRSRIDIDGVC